MLDHLSSFSRPHFRSTKAKRLTNRRQMNCLRSSRRNSMILETFLMIFLTNEEKCDDPKQEKTKSTYCEHWA